MPNIKSAMKRVRTSEMARQRNVAASSRIKTLKKKLAQLVTDGAKEKAVAQYKELCSVLDKSAKVGIIGKNTATRGKTRAESLLRKAQML